MLLKPRQSRYLRGSRTCEEGLLMISLKEFKDYYKHLDEMIAESTKADLAECARLLALNVAHYKSKYGELPIEEH